MRITADRAERVVDVNGEHDLAAPSIAAVPVLIVPGWTNSGPEHWQSRWEREHPDWRRVHQADWDHPDPDEWLGALHAEVVAAARRARVPPLLIGHSLGALLIALWAASRSDARASGALLVAPPDVDRADTPQELVPFRPMPRTALPFPAVVAASRNDPYISWERAKHFADSWAADLQDCGFAGHLNTASGYGAWPEGEAIVARLLARAG